MGYGGGSLVPNGFAADSFLDEVMRKADMMAATDNVLFKFMSIADLEGFKAELDSCRMVLECVSMTKRCWEHKARSNDVEQLAGTLCVKVCFINERLFGLKALRARFPTQYSCSPYPTMNGIAIGV